MVTPGYWVIFIVSATALALSTACELPLADKPEKSAIGIAAHHQKCDRRSISMVVTRDPRPAGQWAGRSTGRL